jgi:hypothetical protein
MAAGSAHNALVRKRDVAGIKMSRDSDRSLTAGSARDAVVRKGDVAGVKPAAETARQHM